MKHTSIESLCKREAEISARLANSHEVRERPMMAQKSLHYEVSDRVDATAWGGVPVMLQLAQRIGLVEAIDKHVDVLKLHKPYHESDHVMNIALNILAGGTCLEDLELRRQDTAYLNALGAERIPDPTTAGDFTRRFRSAFDVWMLQESINVARRKVWRDLPAEERQTAFLDVDGTIAPTTGECKAGMGLAYNGVWGYHPLVVSLSNTREPLYLVNRPGNRPSHDGSAEWINRAIELVQPYFRDVWLRGDTDFSLTENFDGWSEAKVHFIFGIDAMANLTHLAQELPETSWKPVSIGTEKKSHQRRHAPRIKAGIVYEKRYRNLRLTGESFAEFPYRPGKCNRDYRVIVVRKNISVERGEEKLIDEIRYFFYITNEKRMGCRALLKRIHGRCDHENDIEQLKNGIHAMRMPSGDLHSNWAYMVMAALAWSLKSWMAVLTRNRTERHELLRMEFRRFLNGFMAVPAQVCTIGRQLRVRLLAWTRHIGSLLLFMERLRCMSAS